MFDGRIHSHTMEGLSSHTHPQHYHMFSYFNLQTVTVGYIKNTVTVQLF